MHWDTIIVLLALLCALACVIRHFTRARKGGGCCGSTSCACSCGQGDIVGRNNGCPCSGNACTD